MRRFCNITRAARKGLRSDLQHRCFWDYNRHSEFAMPSSIANFALQEFLRQHNIADEEFQKSGVKIPTLEAIREIHLESIGELESAADYVGQRLHRVPAVHSLKRRIKDPWRLVAKVVRKQLEDPTWQCIVENYTEQITDLVGVRALHLFKDEWKEIDEFVKENWEFHENPTAYYRAGDPEPLLDAFAEAGLCAKEHQFGYRSVHYLLLVQPSKKRHVIELQVRTIFEEGWSEIDHRIRYPRRSSDTHLSGILRIFNRLAGGADELGTFVRALDATLERQSARESEATATIAQLKSELRKLVGMREIDKEKLAQLEKQIEETQPKFGLFSGLLSSNVTTGVPLSSSAGLFGGEGFDAGRRAFSTCKKCGRLGLFLGDECPDCLLSR